MNYWTKLSVDFAQQRNYLDELYKVYPITPNLRRDICVIDPETTEEIKPRLYFDEKENKVKGKCKLKPNKSYFAFEVRGE